MPSHGEPVTGVVQLRAADIFLTRGTGLFSQLIRVFTRGVGEQRTKVNHVGVVVKGGGLHEAIVVEALLKVRRHRLARYARSKETLVAVYRVIDLAADEVETIVRDAEEYVGKRYGFGMLIAHFLDWCLQGAYVFRRLTEDGEYPICSWLVAHSFGEVGITFGVPVGAANPDDISDFIDDHPGKFEQVRPLEPLDL